MIGRRGPGSARCATSVARRYAVLHDLARLGRESSLCTTGRRGTLSARRADLIPLGPSSSNGGSSNRSPRAFASIGYSRTQLSTLRHLLNDPSTSHYEKRRPDPGSAYRRVPQRLVDYHVTLYAEAGFIVLKLGAESGPMDAVDEISQLTWQSRERIGKCPRR